VIRDGMLLMAYTKMVIIWKTNLEFENQIQNLDNVYSLMKSCH